MATRALSRMVDGDMASNPAAFSSPIPVTFDYMPQQFASDGSDAVGYVQFWGNSPAVDLLPKQASEGKCEEISEEPYHVLQCGGADLRHVLKTLAARTSRRDCDVIAARPIHFHLHELCVETLARHVLLLMVATDTRIPVRERSEVFLSIFGNSLVREKDAEVISEYVPELLNLVTGESTHPIANVLDFSSLKFKDRDSLQEVFQGWRKTQPFDTEALRDQRLRGYYRGRYDHRINLLDWDWNTCIKNVAPLVHWQHYKEFGLSGVAFETRLGSYASPNRTLASYVDGKSRTKGTSILVRGYWADIINSPFFCFGVNAALPDSLDVDERARIMKKHTESYRHTAVDLSMFAINSFLQELETGEAIRLPGPTKAEAEWPYESPLERIQKIPTEVEQKELQLVKGFHDVKISLMCGDLADTVKKSKYTRQFDSAFFGNMSATTLFKAGGLTEEGYLAKGTDPMKPLPASSFGCKGDSPLAQSLKEGCHVTADSFKFQVHFDGKVKLAFRRRIWESLHNMGCGILRPRQASPRLEPDMKNLKAHELDQQADDFLTFIQGVASEGQESSVVYVDEEAVAEALKDEPPAWEPTNCDLPA